MFTEKHFPKLLSGQELDNYLERGWYRHGQSVFTCHLLFYGSKIFSPIWLRMPLPGHVFRKSHRKLMNRCGRQFRTEIGPGCLSDEKEALFQRYSENFKGELAPTLSNSLHDDLSYNIFYTKEVAVYDGERLVAFSFFDIGEHSLASIKGVYDPDYAAHSLGFYTMLCEIQYGLEQGFQFYYPGYFVPGNPRFDYKLRIGRRDEIQFYEPRQGEWRPFGSFNGDETPIEVFSKKLLPIGQSLANQDVYCQLLFYPSYEEQIFNRGKMPLRGAPLILSCFTHVFLQPRFFLYFDIWTEKLVFAHCATPDELARYLDAQLPSGRWLIDFLTGKNLILETKDENEIVQLVAQIARYLRPISPFQMLFR